MVMSRETKLGRGGRGAAHVLLAAGLNCTHTRTHRSRDSRSGTALPPAVVAHRAPFASFRFVGRTADDHHSGISIGLPSRTASVRAAAKIQPVLPRSSQGSNSGFEVSWFPTTPATRFVVVVDGT